MKITGIELEQEDIDNILTDTLETNAIGYWSIFLDWTRKEDNSVTEIVIKELNENESGFRKKKIYINQETIKKGVELIVKGTVVASYIREMILNNDIDSEGCDCIVQAGLFGEIKYG